MPRQVKETLNARVQFMSDESDGRTHSRINQYTILDEIGRGSYGAVHSATDQYGNEFAVKEFSKARLRRRAQSHILRRGPRQRPRHLIHNADSNSSGSDRLPPQLGGLRASEEGDALYLIREEVAIMKKLHHPNVVQLIEVLDDPEEDTLYMVLEMCKKGVVMKVNLDEQAEAYDEESCRCWFRDLILGIEYLHAQGVIHRDIKPDNLLLSEDDVLKVVDFGVSEMFEKADDMRIASSAGSPAFLPPELCGKHADVSGKAADIWSMGVSLFCFRYGRIPFSRDNVLQMYEAIKSDRPSIPDDENPQLVDLFDRILEKDPAERIKMAQLREHPWVTKDGEDPLLSAEENCAHEVEPPNELELNRAFTRKMDHMLYVIRAINRFKALLGDRRGENVGGQVKAAGRRDLSHAEARAQAEAIEALINERASARGQEQPDDHRHEHHDGDSGETDRGHAHVVTSHHGTLVLGIGTGGWDGLAMDDAKADVVSDSPAAVDFDVYDRAYQQAIERHVQADAPSKPTVYLTKFVKDRDRFKKLENLVEESAMPSRVLGNPGHESTRQRIKALTSHEGGKLAQLVSKLVPVAGQDGEGEKKSV